MLMQPNTPAPESPGQYDFILNSQSAPKRSILQNMGGSKKQRILVFAVGGALLLLLVILLWSLLFGGKKEPALLEIAQTQSELMRVSQLGGQKASSSSAKALAVNTELTITSQQKTILEQLKKQKQKTNAKVLAAKKNSKTDEVLSQASTNNRFDEVFAQTIQSELVDYQKLLRSAHDASSNQALRNIYDNDSKQAALIVLSTK